MYGPHFQILLRAPNLIEPTALNEPSCFKLLEFDYDKFNSTSSIFYFWIISS